MGETKTYVIPDSNSNLIGMLAPMLQQRGIDPNVLAVMRNGDFGGNSCIWIIFLLFLFGWNRNGWGNDANTGYLSNAINNGTGRELIMSAIQGNATAISQLATTLNCDVNAIQGAINGVQSSISALGNQVGLSSQQVINSIQLGNQTLAQQLCSCCCDMKQLVTSQGYENQLATLNQTNQLQNSIDSSKQATVTGFSNLGYITQQQTCDIQKTVDAGIQRVIDGQNAAITRELQNKINSQAEEISTYKATAATSQIVAQAMAPVNAALANLSTEVNTIKGQLPPTVAVPYPQLTAVPNLALYGGNTLGTGVWG